MTVTAVAAGSRHHPVLRRVHGGWVAGCACGWQWSTVVPRERTARRLAWDHIGGATQ